MRKRTVNIERLDHYQNSTLKKCSTTITYDGRKEVGGGYNCFHPIISTIRATVDLAFFLKPSLLIMGVHGLTNESADALPPCGLNTAFIFQPQRHRWARRWDNEPLMSTDR